MNLNSLPLELLARIFVNLGEINPGQLSLASRKWQAVTKGIHESYIGNSMNLIYDDLGKTPSKHCLDKQNRAFYLLRKYDLLKKQFLKGWFINAERTLIFIRRQQSLDPTCQ